MKKLKQNIDGKYQWYMSNETTIEKKGKVVNHDNARTVGKRTKVE